MLRFVFATLMLAILSTLPSFGHAVENGTRAIVSDLSYWGLITRLEAAIKRQKLKIISRASVRGAERQKKLGIPGNMVIGAFDDDYTARILRANVAAGIEAPIRFYITRHPDEKTTTLWYRRPSWVLAPYSDRTGELRTVGEELDRLMAAIAAEATGATGSKKRPKRVMVKRETAKPKAKTAKAAAVKPKAKAPKPVAKATPARTVKPAAKRAEAAPPKTAKTAKAAKTAKLVASPKPPKLRAAPRKLAAPKPLIPKKPDKPASPVVAAKSGVPVARAGPKPLTAADAKTAEAKSRQRANAPVETAKRSTASAAARRSPPSAKPDPARDAISLTPLMLRLQGQ